MPSKAAGSVHVVDASLREIASDNLFTVEEVKAYYDRCGEMLRTADRFQKMRAMLNANFAED